MNAHELQELRSRRLEQWIHERFDGSETAFLNGTGFSFSQLYNWLTTRMPEATARRIEEKAKMPPNWLDQAPGSPPPRLIVVPKD